MNSQVPNTVLQSALKAFTEQAGDTSVDLSGQIEQISTLALSTGYKEADRISLHAAFKELRSSRRFYPLIQLAEAVENAGIEDPFILKHHAQALVETKSYSAAKGILAQARELAFAAGDLQIEEDCWGIEGRIYKDLYVQAVSQQGRLGPRPALERTITRAIVAYHRIWKRGLGTSRDTLRFQDKRHYFGVNAMALAARAARDNIALPADVSPAEIADTIQREVREHVANSPEEDITAWDLAGAAEAFVALEEWDEAMRWTNRYLKEAANDGFALNGTLRQFTDVWGLSESHPGGGAIVRALRMALIAAEDGGMVLTASQVLGLRDSIDETRDQFQSADAEEDFSLVNQKVHGTEGPMSLRRLQEIMNAARGVGRVKVDRMSGSHTIGTGFVLAGKWFDQTLADKVYFITNAHVVSSHPQRDGGHAVRPGQAFATFDLAPEIDDVLLDKLIWCSGHHDHDMSVFEIPNTCRELGMIPQVGRGLPNLKRKVMKPGSARPHFVPGKVFVIGYPLGRELSISLLDNRLIDHESVRGRAPGPEPRRIQYRAPTEPGSSGSPVFNSLNLQLIGVHHRGGNLRRLNGKSGRQAANQAMWIRPAINEFRLELGFDGDMFEATV